MIKKFEIMFDSLNVDAQKELCEEFDTNPDDENWEYIPLTIIEREMDENQNIGE